MEVLRGEVDEQGGVDTAYWAFEIGVDFSVVEDMLHPDQEAIMLAGQFILIPFYKL